MNQGIFTTWGYAKHVQLEYRNNTATYYSLHTVNNNNLTELKFGESYYVFYGRELTVFSSFTIDLPNFCSLVMVYRCVSKE